MKTPLVFSFIKEQKVFLTLLMSLLTFLSVLGLGLVISLSTAITRWNAEWSLMATVQITPGATANSAADSVRKILDGADSGVAARHEISESDAKRILRPWLQDGGVLAQYIPKMTEIKFKDRAGMNAMAEKIKSVPGARFVRHNDAMQRSADIGRRIIFLSVFVLLLVLGAAAACVSYITRNITLIHKRELEILNLIGAHDSFVAAQLMFIIARICATAAIIGFAAGVPALLIISGISAGMKVGMFSQMAIPFFGWVMLFLLAGGIIALSVWTARRTVIDILKEAQ
ncbi:MAG: hypothetical protein FWG39_03985 [Alphaproteobacteria bacterium]|nr:hypothetical protein [Alphaproteobacteria bacterium]